MIKVALFDLDGVVFDTERQYSIFWGDMGKKYHPEMPDFSKRIKGQTLDQIYAAFFADMQEEQAHITLLLNEFETHMQFEYVPGILPFLGALRQRHIKTGIVTSSNRAKMASVYQAHPEIKELFDHIFTAEDFSRSKPDPECYLTGAKYFGVRPDECMGLEDSFNGLKSVKAAGMYVVGLTTTNSEEDIREYCDVVIKDYTNWTRKIHLSI